MPGKGATVREERSVLLLVIAVAWLVVAARYGPWTYHIARSALRGREFTVDRWTLLNPLITVALVPVSLALLWRRNDGVAAIMLTIPAAAWILWEVLDQELILLAEPIPQLVAIQVLSFITLLVVGAYAVRRSICG